MCNLYNNLYLKYQESTYLGIFYYSKQLSGILNQLRRLNDIIDDDKE